MSNLTPRWPAFFGLLELPIPRSKRKKSANSSTAGSRRFGHISSVLSPTNSLTGSPAVLTRLNFLAPILVELCWLLSLVANIGNHDRFEENFVHFGGGDAGQAGLAALEGGLLGVCLYEMARQSRPAVLRQAHAEIPGILRTEADARRLPGGGPDRGASDPGPINLAFTYSGLQALGIDSTMLDSFPTAFKQGMAARARRAPRYGPERAGGLGDRARARDRPRIFHRGLSCRGQGDAGLGIPMETVAE